MRDTQTLNGGESGEWWRYEYHVPLDPDETRPVPSLPNLSDADILQLLSRLEPPKEASR